METRRLFHLAERVIRPVSLATLAGLIAAAAYRYGSGGELPHWLAALLLPVLTSAAVGYLTNFVAIEMLFKPYRREDHHWLRYASFGLWRQGLIPANKGRIGRVLGEEIPKNLLDADEIAEELTGAAADILRRPEVVERFRETLNRFLHRYSEEIGRFTAPYVEGVLREAFRENLTPETLVRVCDRLVRGYLAAPERRDALASGITAELQRRTPELTELIRISLKDGVREYLRTKLRLLPVARIPSDLAAGLIDYLDWEQIRIQLGRKFAEPATQDAIRDELLRGSERLREYFRTPEAAESLNRFLTEASGKLETMLKRYLEERLPEMTRKLFHSEELWEVIRSQTLPAAERALGRYLAGDGRRMIAEKLDLPRRIERSVENQNIEDFHRMINAITDEHLVAIQVLGYLLGALAGILLILPEL